MRRRLNRLAVAAWCGSVLLVGGSVGSGDESSDGGPPTFPVDQPLDLVILAAPGDRGVADPLAPAASESLGRLNPLRTWAPGPGAVAGDRAAPATVADLAVLGAPVDVRAGP